MKNPAGTLICSVVLACSCFAQENRIRTTALEVTSSTQVPLFAASGITTPISCSEDNTIFVRPVDPAGLQDLIAVPADGKFVTSYSRDRIKDVSNPQPSNFFVQDSSVYLLVSGSYDPHGVSVRTKNAAGEIEQRNITAARSRAFIARFDRDGSYDRAIPLDIPFKVYQFGVFPDGSFLVAGSVIETSEPKIALLRSNGQLERYLDLGSDVRADAPAVKDFKEQGSSLFAGAATSLSDVIRLSLIVPDGNNLLLVRRGPHIPIFSISAGGAVKEIELKVPANYSLFTLRARKDVWIAQFLYREKDVPGSRFIAFSLDPMNGQLLESFAFPQGLGFGLACTDGLEFAFLRIEENKLMLIKAMSSHRASSTGQNEKTDQGLGKLGK